MVSDTTPEADRFRRERLLRMTPSQRVEEGIQASKLAREFMRAGIRMRHAEYTAEEVELCLARLLWGSELYQKALPGRPLLDP